MTRLLTFAVLIALPVQSLRGRTELAFDGIAISIDYGRPGLNGRELARSLPVGHVWRLGADAATTIETSHDLNFEDVRLLAGSYSLFLKRRGPKAWALIFNSETGQWGTQHDVTMDVAKVPMESTTRGASTELLTIELSRDDQGGRLAIEWGEDVLTVRFVPDTRR